MMREYKERVRRAAEARTGEPIYNGSLEHAAVLAEVLFSVAHRNVRILSSELNARVYGRDEVVEQANLFLADPSHEARILVENGRALDWKNHPLLRSFLDNENIKVKVVPAEIQDRYSFHMFVVDLDCYRFERDKKNPSAVAAFGDARGAENLSAIFDKLWDSSEEVSADNLQ